MSRSERLAAEKSALRREMRARLSRLEAGQALAVGRAVSAALRASSVWARAERVCLFSSLPDEVDTGPIREHALQDGKGLLLPRMSTTESALEFVELDPARPLRAGRFGVLEPDALQPAVRLSEDMLILVPGLAFDRRGGRLGRGAGYYDRGLRSESERTPLEGPKSAGRPTRIGIGFGFQVLNQVPMGPCDVRLDGLVTEEDRIGVDE